MRLLTELGALGTDAWEVLKEYVESLGKRGIHFNPNASLTDKWKEDWEAFVREMKSLLNDASSYDRKRILRGCLNALVLTAAAWLLSAYVNVGSSLLSTGVHDYTYLSRGVSLIPMLMWMLRYAANALQIVAALAQTLLWMLLDGIVSLVMGSIRAVKYHMFSRNE